MRTNMERSSRRKDREVTNMTDDSLLVQIDAFREKAKRLQTLIDDRKSQMIELEEKVRDQENKNLELQNTIKKRQAVAQDVLEDVLEDVRDQFEDLDKRLTENLSQMEGRLTDLFKEQQGQNPEIVIDTEELKLRDDSSIEELKSDLSTKIHAENVRMYRNIQDFITEQGNIDEVEEALTHRIRSVSRVSLIAMLLGIGDTVLLLFIIALVLGFI